MKIIIKTNDSKVCDICEKNKLETVELDDWLDIDVLNRPIVICKDCIESFLKELKGEN